MSGKDKKASLEHGGDNLICYLYPMPNLYIIAGCNGAGKTTASYTILSEMFNCKEFVNEDSIATGLSPFNAESAAFTAGRIMLQRIHQLINEKEDFIVASQICSIFIFHCVITGR